MGMRRRELFTCAVLGLAALPVPAAARTLRHVPLANVRPRAFASCTNLIGYARNHFRVTHGLPEPPVTPISAPAAYGPQGVSAPAPASSTPSTGGSATGTANSPSFSTTNNQEVGVDEPDIVKTNGSTIFTVAQNKLYAVAARGSVLAIVGSLDLGASGYGAQLLLRGNRLIAISSGAPVAVPLGAASPPLGAPVSSIYPSPYYGGQTVITEVDVQDPAAMRVTRTMTVDGHFVDARQSGASARLVISSAPAALATPALRARASGWVPTRRFHSMLSGRRYVRAVAACGAIRRPVQFSGLGMLTILTIDLDRGLYAADSQALMADAQVVYGSQSSLYVATQKWIDPQTAPSQLPAATSTVIDRFNVTDPLHTTLVASGEVPGYVLNQYSMSEFKGYLRVATTSRPIWWDSQAPASSQSYVTVLASQGGQLVPVGQVSGLGAGQQIYSVRFVDDTGYVVTFRHVDPLYTIDLSLPTAPRVTGTLELQGYSAYLHPVAKGLLLGVGQDVGTAINEPAGVQLELFDVSDAGAPKLLARTTLGDGSFSEVQYDPHAFLFWPPTQLAVLPVQIYPFVQSVPPGVPTPAGSVTTKAPSPSGAEPSAQGEQFTGAIAFHVDRTGIAEAGRVSHDSINGYVPPIHRSVVIGDMLYTVSDGGVMASSLATLAREGFAAFPTSNVVGTGVVGSGTALPPSAAASSH
jgi:hypothetical protein